MADTKAEPQDFGLTGHGDLVLAFHNQCWRVPAADVPKLAELLHSRLASPLSDGGEAETWPTPEAEARHWLADCGVENADQFSSGDLVGLANVLAERTALRRRAEEAERERQYTCPEHRDEVKKGGRCVWCQLRAAVTLAGEEAGNLTEDCDRLVKALAQYEAEGSGSVWKPAA